MLLSFLGLEFALEFSTIKDAHFKSYVFITESEYLLYSCFSNWIIFPRRFWELSIIKAYNKKKLSEK